MGQLTTHVLDTARGRPARGVRIDVGRREAAGTLQVLGTVWTAETGRTDGPLLAGPDFRSGEYELVFHVGAYFRDAGVPAADPPFLDLVPVRFAVAQADGHYHVPLLVSPWSYTTYRGA